MRAIRYRIQKGIPAHLKENARENRIDVGFVCDLYSLLRMQGSGIPDDKRIAKMAKQTAKKQVVSERTVSGLLKKRVQQLKQICKTAYFKKAARRKDSVDSLRSIVTSFLLLHRKVREAQCLSCPLLKDCDFGKQYKDSARDVSKVLDPDYSKKVHPQCPVLPEIDRNNQLAGGATSFHQMCQPTPQNTIASKHGCSPTEAAALDESTKDQESADEEEEPPLDDDLTDDSLDVERDDTPSYASDMSDGHAAADRTGVDFAGNSFRVYEDLIKQLTSASLSIFELGTKFTLLLGSQKAGKFNPTSQIDESSRQRTIKKEQDITKIDANQLALPPEVFDKKHKKKELTMREDLEEEKLKKLLYALIDSSGSMAGQLGSNHRLLSRGALAATLCVALSYRVEEDGGIMFLRFFDQGCTALISARTKEEFERLRFHIANASYNGGGTNILHAVHTACKDIANIGGEIAEAEILAVTDCEDSFSVPDIQRVTKGREFNILDVSGGNYRGNASQQLRQCATKYFKANENGVDCEEIVKLI